jgi:ATP-dependent Clp protease ATP-binding subunit ClpA
MATIEQVNILLYRRDVAEDQSNDDELQLDTTDYRAPPSSTRTSSVPMTDRSRQIINTARESTADSHRVFVDSVDVLLAMLRESEGIAGRVLADLHIDIGTVERSLRDEVSRDAPSDSFLTGLEAKSYAEAKWLEHRYVGTEHLLLALCEIRPTAATDILMRLGVQPRDICESVLQILGHQDDWQRWLADHPDM